MRPTQKSRCAVTAMLDLALSESHQTKLVSIKSIAERHGLTRPFLEQLFSLLRKHDLVESVRGPNGGYRLSRAAETITLADIFSAVDEKTDATRCNNKGNCQNGTICLTHEIWTSINRVIDEHLAVVSLQSLREKATHRQIWERQKKLQHTEALN